MFRRATTTVALFALVGIGHTSDGTLFEEGILELSFADGSGATQMSAANDGTFLYTVSGGGPTGERFARYLPDGTLDLTFASGIDFRSIFTDDGGNLYSKAFGAGDIHSLTQGGEGTLLFTLNSSEAQSSASFNGPDTELYTRAGETIRRWDATNGTALGSFQLLGMGPGELSFPAGIQMETNSEGRIFTYANGIVSEWDLAGNRIGTCMIPIPSPSDFFTTWSFGVASDRVYLYNSLSQMWEVYDVGICNSKPDVYCTAKTNSIGCVPEISASGCARASANNGFQIVATQVRNQKAGTLIYGLSGRAATSFQGGVLCMSAPVYRTPARSSGGNMIPIQDCSGRYRIDMTAFAAGAAGGDPRPELLVPGTLVQSQWWARDIGDAFGSSLSDALEYEVSP